MVKQLAANCQLLQQDGNTIRLGLDPRCKQLLSPKAEKRSRTHRAMVVAAALLLTGAMSEAASIA